MPPLTGGPVEEQGSGRRPRPSGDVGSRGLPDRIGRALGRNGLEPQGGRVMSDGRVVMISGANRGIGAAIAAALAGRGWRLSLGVRTPDRASAGEEMLV